MRIKRKELIDRGAKRQRKLLLLTKYVNYQMLTDAKQHITENKEDER